MLLADEISVARWLSQYGVLPKELLIRLLNLERPTAERVLRNVRREGRAVYYGSPEWLAPDEYAKPNERIIRALWVMSKFADKLQPQGDMPGQYPAQVVFLKDGACYHIVDLAPGEEHNLRLLAREDMTNTKYILVLPDIYMAQRLTLPRAPCLLATVDYSASATTPKIRFYSTEGST